MISIYQPFDVTARALIEFYALSGADINKFNVRKGQSITLAGIQQCWRLYPRSILSPPRLSALGKHCDGCTRGLYHSVTDSIRLTELRWWMLWRENNWIETTTTFKSCVFRRCQTCALSVHHLESLSCFQSWQINAWQLWLEAGLW